MSGLPEPIGRNSDHQRESGGFQIPWPVPPPGRRGGVLRWSIERARADLPPSPGPASLPEQAAIIAEVSETITAHGGTRKIKLVDKLGALNGIAKISSA